MNDTQKWPDRLWLVRHGESAGNVARDAAEAAGHPVIDIPTRDADVPLSALGERQARALGDWFPSAGARRNADSGTRLPLSPRPANGADCPGSGGIVPG